MNRIIAAFLFSVLLVSCDSGAAPSGILSEDQMVNILIDIQLTEGMVSAIPIPYDSSQILYSLMEKDVFFKNGVQGSIFGKNFRCQCLRAQWKLPSSSLPSRYQSGLPAEERGSIPGHW